MSSAEDDLIARYFRPLADDPGAYGLIDDAAVLNCGSDDLVVTADAVVEGTHFLPHDPPDTVARKALRVNLSDIAAKGARPAGFVLTLALREVNDSWLAPFARALGEDAAAYGCPLLGGDTVSTPGPLMISVTAFGRVARGRTVRRRGAQPGDLVVVSGTIGEAVLGLAVLSGQIADPAADAAMRAALAERYRIPQPRTDLAASVRDHASAAMDVSDGLAGDLAKLCGASGVTADIELGGIPLSPAARLLTASGAIARERLICGGDDYEILCTVPESRIAGFTRSAAEAGVPVSVIGVIRAGRGLPRFRDSDGRATVFERGSFSHF